MAKVKFSALISEMRNKLNGSVFSRNRGGAYIRNKVTPLNPNTTAQRLVRATLTFLSQNWRALTAAQRLAWSAAVANFKTTDIFGDIKTPSGINLYNRLNLNLSNAEKPFIVDPPLPTNVAESKIVSLVAGSLVFSGADSLVLTIDAPVPVGTTLVIIATPQLSAGKVNVKSEGTKLTKADAGTAAPIDLTSAYVAKYGAMIHGEKITIFVKNVSNATGLVTGTLEISAIVD